MSAVIPLVHTQALETERAETAAAIYDHAGDDYVAYADGDPNRLFAFDGAHAYADRYVWSVLETKLAALRASGANSIRLLDAGCGPGTWLRRLVAKAHSMGFGSISARGFDIAQAQVRRARMHSTNLANLPGVSMQFDVADLTDRLPEADASVDIAICLYSVLSHLPVARLPDVAAEMARVTSGHFITTARSIGSLPTGFVDSLEAVCQLKQDNTQDRCEISFHDGRASTFDFHLFSAAELRGYFAHHGSIEDVRGLDLFHSRFLPDPRWNPKSMPTALNLNELACLEHFPPKTKRIQRV